MPPDMVLHACPGTSTVSSLICGVISSIRKALPLSVPLPWQASAVGKGSGGGWWAGGVAQTGCAGLTSFSNC